MSQLTFPNSLKITQTITITRLIEDALRAENEQLLAEVERLLTENEQLRRANTIGSGIP